MQFDLRIITRLSYGSLVMNNDLHIAIVP